PSTNNANRCIAIPLWRRGRLLPPLTIRPSKGILNLADRGVKPVDFPPAPEGSLSHGALDSGPRRVRSSAPAGRAPDRKRLKRALTHRGVKTKPDGRNKARKYG